MRAAMEILDAREVDFAFEGEMSVDAALDRARRQSDNISDVRISRSSVIAKLFERDPYTRLHHFSA